MKHKRLVVVLLALAMVIGAIGPVAAQSRKVVTVLFDQEFDMLNPMYSTMSYTALARDFYLFGAWNFDENLAPNPILVTEIPSAENGGISEDGLTLTLNLRDDLTWSDGEPLTSADFVFTYDMMMSSANSPLSRYPYDPYVASVEAPDATTVVITFSDPFASWLTQIFDWVIPEHVLRPVLEAEGTLDNAAWNRAPSVGNGPFVFEQWESGSHVYFVKNENYWGGDVPLDGVFVRFIPDEAAITAALMAGDGDVAYFLSPSNVVALEEGGNVNVVWVPAGYNEGWTFNLNPETAHPAMLDVRVRKALAMAVDRWKINEDLRLGFNYVPASFWEGTPYQAPDLEPIPFDVEGAMALLDEAGWVDSNGDGTRDKDGVELVLRYATPPKQVRMDTQVVVQQMLAEVGVGVILENPSYDIFWNSYSSGGPIAIGEYDFAQWSSNTSFPDPDNADFICGEIPNSENPEGNNWSNYCNEEVDALFTQQATTTDPAARIEIFHQITTIMAEDLPWLGIWTDPDNYAVSTRLQNAKINGTTPFWNAFEWDIQ